VHVEALALHVWHPADVHGPVVVGEVTPVPAGKLAGARHWLVMSQVEPEVQAVQMVLSLRQAVQPETVHAAMVPVAVAPKAPVTDESRTQLLPLR